MLRHNKIKPVFVVAMVLVLQACVHQPFDAMTSRGDPEHYLTNSLEHVTVPLDAAQGLDDLMVWLDESRPMKAIVQCTDQDLLCNSAVRMLEGRGVAIHRQTSGSGNQVVLVYERMSIHDCDPRFVEVVSNPHNYNNPAWGCSVATNTLRMISDKQQITNPGKVGPLDGTEAAIIYDDYLYGEPIFEGESGTIIEDVTAE